MNKSEAFGKFSITLCITLNIFINSFFKREYN